MSFREQENITESDPPNNLQGFAAALLSALASIYPSPIADRDKRLGGQPGSVEYERAYTFDQYMSRVVGGFPLGRAMPSLLGKDVLELGCGHGGVTCYLASLGARRVVGIDINTTNFHYGLELADKFSQEGKGLPVEFLEMDCMNLTFSEAFDVVYADNAFEHYTDPEKVFQEAFRVLRPNGYLLVPTFSSIFSKYGLHLKYGLKLPWANLLFSEKTIVGAVQRQARKRRELFDLYPGLRKEPGCVRDLRKHGDLNNITHAKFLQMATRTGFKVKTFRVHATLFGKILRRLIPSLERAFLFDVLSTGAGAVLQKPEGKN